MSELLDRYEKARNKLVHASPARMSSVGLQEDFDEARAALLAALPAEPAPADEVLIIDPIDIMSTWAETLMEDQSKMLDFAIAATLYKLGVSTVTINGGDLAMFLQTHRIERRAETGQGWSVTLVPREDPGQGQLDLAD